MHAPLIRAVISILARLVTRPIESDMVRTTLKYFIFSKLSGKKKTGS